MVPDLWKKFNLEIREPDSGKKIVEILKPKLETYLEQCIL